MKAEETCPSPSSSVGVAAGPGPPNNLRFSPAVLLLSCLVPATQLPALLEMALLLLALVPGVEEAGGRWRLGFSCNKQKKHYDYRVRYDQS